MQEIKIIVEPSRCEPMQEPYYEYQYPEPEITLIQYKNKPFMEVWESAENQDERDDAIMYLVNNIADKFREIEKTKKEAIGKESIEQQNSIRSKLDDVLGMSIAFINNHKKEISRRFVLPLVIEQIKNLADTYNVKIAQQLIRQYKW
jgi:hypothetical protein